ncbi:hypothetical protein JMJ77_0012191 [Colletotrichum scovillei]|uniref:Uncharacterized protein n=1 Tax=Colletotrichum scovillei TaxID=1209932 RepID=A0A9P7QSE4_9PEZI|nr:hypothetical protein JMJ78_0001243 [Colletotrichum scovillei]KAG7041672.1 hypothetical protein JMJ77_0012191 [Colletotrichum scovillei]KAG7061700.1 hypothetical protein JMJ76_0003659 [Colletotrichum scovillei]
MQLNAGQSDDMNMGAVLAILSQQMRLSAFMLGPEPTDGSAYWRDTVSAGGRKTVRESVRCLRLSWLF